MTFYDLADIVLGSRTDLFMASSEVAWMLGAVWAFGEGEA